MSVWIRTAFWYATVRPRAIRKDNTHPGAADLEGGALGCAMDSIGAVTFIATGTLHGGPGTK
jgi:hypothetical protein